MKRFTLILSLLCCHTIVFATISMQIAPSTAHLNETLRLTLTQDHDPQFHGTPDLTPLKKDFTIIGTEHNMSYSAINGVAKSESQWIILLIAKNIGQLPIPPIRIGQQESQAGQVTIISRAPAPTLETQAERSDDENNAVSLHAEVDQHNPFINQQVVYTVKLSTRESLLNAQYQAPSVENALVIPLGDGRRYQTTVNGQEYSVDEQQYAIYPQKSGELQINPPKLSAIIYDAVPNHINIEANATRLTVKPIPEKNAHQQWLPAKQVSLTEQYDSSTPTMIEGSTLVRTITLRANGLPAELLPILTFTDSEQYSVYPEKPDTENALRQQELIGTSSTKVTYILSHPGNITLPSIELPWFNTQTGQHEVATLPSHTIMITPKSSSNPPPIVTPQQPHHKKKTHPSPVPAPAHPSQSIAWWIAGAFALAWILTMLLWWMRQHRRDVTKPTLRQALKNLRLACETNDPTQAHIALLNWGQLQWPDVTLFNLSELSKLSDSVMLKNQINLLSEKLYSQNLHANWNGKALWQAVANYRPNKRKKSVNNDGLPPMNPI